MKILELVLFLTLVFEEGVFYYVNYKILRLDSPKSVILLKKPACFTKGYFMKVLRGKMACFFGVNEYNVKKSIIIF